ncbi:hypothetical protein GQ607_008253 [Colletotrichum asianum]|uniref:Uncharacterized protein n=1 Tax=Colletotrichum asianum TaxID=702518 RepID=A0A8H3ZLR4_9PEZI|nr:hypothetical protein GQ607_008253 [Colletotrichum asianum]
MATRRHDIQFIHSHEKSTLGAKSAEAQRRVHSHAARAAHAKTQRQKVIQYQATKESRNDCNGENSPARTAAENQVSVIPGPIAPLGCGRRDPFASFARRLSPTEDFLLDYYAQNVVPCSTFEHNQGRPPGASARDMSKQFVQLAATSISGLNGLFLVTCRHLSYCLPQQGAHYAQLALQYKVDCARILMQAISTLETQSPISDSIITVAIFLAQDERFLSALAFVRGGTVAIVVLPAPLTHTQGRHPCQDGGSTGTGAAAGSEKAEQWWLRGSTPWSDSNRGAPVHTLPWRCSDRLSVYLDRPGPGMAMASSGPE